MNKNGIADPCDLIPPGLPPESVAIIKEHQAASKKVKTDRWAWTGAALYSFIIAIFAFIGMATVASAVGHGVAGSLIGGFVWFVLARQWTMMASGIRYGESLAYTVGAMQVVTKLADQHVKKKLGGMDGDVMDMLNQARAPKKVTTWKFD